MWVFIEQSQFLLLTSLMMTASESVILFSSPSFKPYKICLFLFIRLFYSHFKHTEHRKHTLLEWAWDNSTDKVRVDQIGNNGRYETTVTN